MSKISGVIICKDEENNIEDCIKSILWCDEVIIIDSFSIDKTIAISKKYSNKIFQNEWKGFSEQRKFALSKANYEWIFSIDADERCTKELEIEIKNLLEKTDISDNGFEIPRKSFFLNKWIRHGGWYPNYQLRLFKSKSAKVSDRLVHESYLVNGTTGRLKNNILHYTVTSISDFVTKINSYSDLSAVEKVKKKRINFFDIFIIPGIAFFHQYILKGNFLDGTAGLMVSKFHMMTKLLNNMKILELQNKKN
ncbi:MAG: glycosyltransferase family 2 protein [Bacteroidota bacterium]|nr:glycosyltransferase family 2 protein [Bacteroidota bacterium]